MKSSMCFDLAIRGSEAAGYTVEAKGPAGGRASAPFDWSSVAGLTAKLRAVQEGAAERAALERVGSVLFQALFPMDVMMAYVASRARLGEGEGLPLRLHLHADLAHLPWELLYYPPFFLATDPRSPIVRFLDLPDAPRPLAVEPPLRLLHLVASPVDATALDAEREAARLRSVLAEPTARGMVESISGRPGTLATLREGLRQGAHILHFSGHGEFAGDRGHLLFEDEDRHGRPVDGDTLAHLLRGSQVRLAVLNACESARGDVSDAFGSVAAALVHAGLPAVVAHQYAMPDRSAIAFAGDFYQALARGFPVDAAVSEGRKAILSTLGDAWRARVDWAAPVLLMRVADGQIFVLGSDREATSAGQPAMSPIHQEVHARDDAAAIGTVTGGTVNIAFGDAPSSVRPGAPPAPADQVAELLHQLRRTVRDHAPGTKRDQALTKITALRDAAATMPPDLASMEAIQTWFATELPALSGAVLSAILSFEPVAEELGDEVLLEFRQRFGRIP